MRDSGNSHFFFDFFLIQDLYVIFTESMEKIRTFSLLNIASNLLKAALLFLIVQADAQVITLGNGYYTNTTLAGPANTSSAAGAASRYAYIFPASLFSALRHGDTIRSVSFMRNGGDSIAGSCNMIIYMRSTVNTTYGNGNINWVNRTSSTGMRKVYDKSPKQEIGRNSGWVRFTFSTPFVLDTVFGRNIEMLVEYTQASSQSNTIYWNYETGGSIGAYQANQTKFVSVNGLTLTDTTRSSSEIHPSVRFEFPRSNFDISVNKIYSLGKLPVPQGNPDTVKAIVQNVGRLPMTYKIFLRSKGANNLIDSAYYSLGYLEEKLIKLPLLYPSNTGMDTLFVTAENDSNQSNNQLSVRRLANANVYSYKDPSLPIAGGIGFNGSTGDFVAKFYSTSPQKINQISVNFAGSTQKFKLGIWKDDGTGGKPGTNVWTSDTLTTAPSFITPVMPAVQVSGNFYVGVRQIGTVNVAFAYQPENPVRPHTFYYTAPTGDTNWVDFAPGAPFKFAIEPRLQAANDVAPMAIITPKDTVKLSNVQTIAPKARILNYGSNNQTTPFTVKMNIFRYGNLVYTSSRQDTLSSGRSNLLVFDSTFLPQQAGDYDVQVMTLLGSDQMKDNDTLRAKFIVAAFRDVGPGTVFDPSFNTDYEQFVDTIYPTVYIQNYGLDAQGPFVVRAQIYDSLNNLIYQDFRTFTLTGLNSVLASFTPFPCSVKGRYFFRAYTDLLVDVKRSNDTVSRYFRIVRSNDVAITSVVYPLNGSSLYPPITARKPEAIMRNVGDAHQADPFQNYCEIYFGGNLIYRDSISVNAFMGSTSTLLFRSFQPVSKGYYRMLVYSSLPTDQYRANDTMTSTFAVGLPDDVEVLAFSPASGGLQLQQTYPTSVTLRNNGYNPQNTPFAVVFMVRSGSNLVYAKVKQVTLDSGKTLSIPMDTTLKISNPGVYDVAVYTTLGNDFKRSNDTLKGVYSGLISYDLRAEAILYPTLDDTLLVNTGAVESLVRVVNYGDSAAEGSFKTVLNVFSKAGGGLLYSKSIDSSMGGTDTLTLKFPAFGLSNPIAVRLQAFTFWDKDQFAKSDTAFSESRFMVLYDAAAAGVLNPVPGSIVRTDAPDFLPRAGLRNNALKQLENVYCALQIKRVDTVSLSETEVYRDSNTLATLSPFMTDTLAMTILLNPAALGAGVYKVYLNAYVPQDQNPFNNTAVSQFRIIDPVGLSSIVKTGGITLYPNPAGNVVHLRFAEVAEPLQGVVSDAKGAVVLRFEASGTGTDLNLNELGSGLYTLSCGGVHIKFIVQKP